MNRRWLLIGLLAVMALGQVALAVRSNLWPDETFSLAMATGHSVEHPARDARPERGDFVEQNRPVSAEELRRYASYGSGPGDMGAVLRAVKLSDTSPPLYYLLLHAWTLLTGTSDLSLRLFSIVMSLACAPILIAIGTMLAGELTGWLAGLLFAMAPLSMYYSSEGRMYSLLWLCVVGAAWATLELHRQPQGKFASAIWVVASVAGLLTHYYFVFSWTAMIAFLLLAPGADRRWRITIRIGLVLLLIAPWYLHLPEILARWRVTQDWVKWKSGNYTLWSVLRDGLIRNFSGNGHNLWMRHHRAEVLALVGFAVAGGLHLFRQRGRVLAGGWLVPWLWLAAAVTGPIVADLACKTYIAEYPRYASAALPAACLLGARWFAGIPKRGWIPAVMLVALCWAPQVKSIALQRGRGDQNIRDAARELGVATRKGDLILIHSIPTGAITFARYFSSNVDLATWVGQLGQRRIPDSLKALIGGHSRVFLVKFHTAGDPAREADWLRTNARVVLERRLGAVFITEFASRGDPSF